MRSLPYNNQDEVWNQRPVYVSGMWARLPSGVAMKERLFMAGCNHYAVDKEVVVTFPFNTTMTVHYPRIVVVCKTCGMMEEAKGEPLWS